MFAAAPQRHVYPVVLSNIKTKTIFPRALEWFPTLLLRAQEGQSEPWNTFATKLAVGMGQMETKVFPATFPEDFEVTPFLVFWW